MSFIPYQEYVSAGIGWLDEVPAHWGKVPLKYTALESDSLFLDGDWIESKDISDDGIKYITTGNVGEGVYKEQGAGFITDEVFGRLRCTEVFPGDILVSRLNYPIGRSCIIPELSARIVTSVDNVIYRPDCHFNKSYLVYLMSSGEYFSHTSDLARGTTMQRISRSLLGNIRIPVPTPEEQIRIAAFLDHETAKIDALIAEQQRLIELLKEKRQAVISHAVTKGLNPNAPMKDSGVEWLGEVPAHWDVTRLKYATSRIVDCPHETPEYDPEGDYLVIRTADVERGVLYPYQMYRLDRAQYLLRTRRAALVGGDIVYGREGERWGHAALVPESDLFCLGQRMMQFRTSRRHDPAFLMFQLNSINVYRQGEVDTVGATSPHVNVSTIRNYSIAEPPLPEQRKIAEHIQRMAADIDGLVSESEQAVMLLQERRSALISAAVTGKMDVRKWRADAAPSSTVPMAAEKSAKYG